MKLVRSAFVISFFTSISRILGFIRDSLIAQIAGVGIISDVFFASFKITNFLRSIIAEGSFFAAFVPSFTKILDENGKIEAGKLASKVFTLMLAVIVIITIICEIFMEQIVALTSPGFLNEKVKFFLTVEISRILFFYFGLVVATSILCGLLNAVKKFSYYAVVPIFLNIGVIAFILLFKNSFKTFAHTLAFGVLFGGVMQILIAYLGCVKEGFKIKLQPLSQNILEPEVKISFKKMVPTIISGSLSQINTLLDSILGSLVLYGISYLYFVDRIFYLPTTLIGTALGVVVLPILSTAIIKGKAEEIKNIQTQSLNIASMLVIPLTFALILCGDVFVSVIFERGNFTEVDAEITSNCLRILGVALPFVIYSKIFSSIFFANNNTKTPMIITLCAVLVNAISSLILLRYFKIYGLIVGSVMSYFFSNLATIFLLKRSKLLLIDFNKTIIFNYKIICSSIIFGFICLFFFHLWHKTSYYQNIFHHSLFVKILYVFGVGGLAFACYLGVLLLLKVNLRSIFSR
jgi:putative peptidoglycan lipid II flippase